jgi:hypothetical protein
LLRYEGGPALAAALFVTDRSRPRRDGTDLLVYFWLVSWLPLIALAKVGASYNHWVEFAAITAVLATLGVWRSLPRFHLWRVRALVPLAVLVITFVAVTPLVGPARMRPSLPAQPQPGPEFATVVQRVRSEPRAVLGVPLDVIALADRPILLEPYIFSILATQGRWDPAPLIRRICGGQVGLLFFFNPLEYGSGSFHGYSFWPPAVVKALQESMVFDSIQNYRYVYVPRSEPLAVPPGSQRACPA